MPQIDIVENLVRCGSGGDNKVSCETLIPSSDADPDPNFPPDSIRIPIQDSDIINYSLNNLERDDSAKESTNPKSHQSHPNPNNANPSSNLHFRSNSQRTNLKANGPILGLPHKIKHVTCTASRHHRTPATNSRIFPKKKSAAASGFEPSSPKVSCFGKVLSDRERGTCRRRRSSESAGCWRGFLVLFSCGRSERATVVEGHEEREDGVAKKDIPLGKRNIPSEEETAAAAPGLGGMKRFASGRRSASWGGDVEVDVDGHVDLGRRSLDGNGVGPVAI